MVQRCSDAAGAGGGARFVVVADGAAGARYGERRFGARGMRLRRPQLAAAGTRARNNNQGTRTDADGLGGLDLRPAARMR